MSGGVGTEAEALVASWSRHTPGRTPDLDAYLADVLALVADDLPVAMRAEGGAELEIHVGDTSARVVDASGRGLLRTLCARLCVLFSQEGGPLPLYGGEVRGVAELRGVRCRAHLSFANDNRAAIQFALSPLG